MIFGVEGLGVTADQFITKLEKKGILASPMGKYKVRLVTHRGINEDDIPKAIVALEDTVSSIRCKTSF